MSSPPDTALESRAPSRLRTWMRTHSTYLTLSGVILALVVYTSLRSDVFLTAGNLRNVLLQVSVLAILAAGTTMLMVSGGLDLSIGAMASVTGVTAALIMRDGGPVLLAVVAAILLGGFLGSINGALAAWSPTHPFIVTLGVAILLRGVAIRLTDGLPISGLPSAFATFASTRFLGLAYPVWIALAVVLLVAFILRYTVFGRRLYALGGSERAAILAGIRPKLTKIALYGLNGLLVGVAALLLTSRISSASAFMGDGLELAAIAAVAVGGTPLAGGRGGIGGTLLGVALLGLISNSLNLLGISAAFQSVLEGLVIVVAVMTQRSRG